jgi:hypothetical protein
MRILLVLSGAALITTASFFLSLSVIDNGAAATALSVIRFLDP